MEGRCDPRIDTYARHFDPLMHQAFYSHSVYSASRGPGGFKALHCNEET